jgi:peptidoglycan/LPS O-acetylase OafA/YrhL
MCMLLRKVAPLNVEKSMAFYFRRIRRIVLLYLFLIITVLLMGLFFVAPTEYYLLFKGKSVPWRLSNKYFKFVSWIPFLDPESTF